jgi:hypothetical protein
VTDTFYRRRRWLIRRPWDYSLPRMAATLAELSAESSVAAAGVRLNLPWGGQVRLDHTAGPGFLNLAEQILDEVDASFPPTTFGPRTRLGRVQQIARADLASRRSKVAQYVDDFEEVIAAAKQSADHTPLSTPRPTPPSCASTPRTGCPAAPDRAAHRPTGPRRSLREPIPAHRGRSCGPGSGSPAARCAPVPHRPRPFG